MSVIESWHFIISQYYTTHDLSQDFETGWTKLAIVKFLGKLFFKEEQNILRLQP